MSNLFDYLAWRGDLPLSQVPFNEIDSLALCQLSYVPYERLMEPGERLPLRQLRERAHDVLLAGSHFSENNQRFFLEAAQSRRFGDLILTRYEHTLEADAQFAAVTFLLPEDFAYVAFRGTDRTLIGWREDLMMAVSEPIPAQQLAVSYLSRVLEEHVGPVLVGGHSKGGNLALYAASVMDEADQRHIGAVYVNDGPGLQESIFHSPGYERIKMRLHVFLPQQSVFGLLLAHPEQFTVVTSSANGILQHDPYSWQLTRDRFVEADALDKDSLYWETVFRRWLEETGEEEYRDAVDALFRVAEAMDAPTIKDILPRIRHNPKQLLHTLREVDAPTRQKVMTVLGNLAGAAWHEAGQILPNRSRQELPAPDRENEPQ